MKDKTITVIPTYNEKENIGKLIADIRGLPGDISVLIVDDGSPDGTGEIVDRLAAKDTKVCIIHRSGKLGLGTAYIEGFKYAFKHKFDNILTMDADFSHNPKYIPSLLEKIKDFDLVVGSRYIQGGDIENWGAVRRFTSWGANLFTRTMLYLKTKDNTGAFRCYHREVLESIQLDTIFSTGYSFLIELMCRCQRMNYTVCEVPYIFVDRELGRSKISKKEIMKAFYTVFRLKWPNLPWSKLINAYHGILGNRLNATESSDEN